MSDLWAKMRRCVAGLMLAAAAALVLHGAAAGGVAGHGIAVAECSSGPSEDRPAAATHHQHAAGGALHAPSGHAPTPDEASDVHAAGTDAAGCGSLCATALTVGSPAGGALPRALEGLLRAGSQFGDGIAAEGPRRPPRRPALA